MLEVFFFCLEEGAFKRAISSRVELLDSQRLIN
jgi:hypothetical protein